MLTVEFAAAALLVHATPLFEEEWHAELLAAILDLPDPILLHRPCPGAGFPSHDYPMDAFEGQARDRSQKRLDRKETNARGNFLKAGDAVDDERVLYTRAHPDVVRPRQFGR